MSALSGKDLRERWIANADRLDKRGHFANYSSKQRDEVRRKGYLGRNPPDQAIKMARLQAEPVSIAECRFKARPRVRRSA